MSAVEKKGNRSELRKLTFETYPDMRVIFTKPELHMAYLLQRTLNKRASEKYKRLKASKKGGAKRILTNGVFCKNCKKVPPTFPDIFSVNNMSIKSIY